MISATRFAPDPAPERSLVATVVGNLLVLALFPPAGAVGLLYCLRARAAARDGNVVRAACHLRSASDIAYVVLFGAFALFMTGFIAVTVALARR